MASFVFDLPPVSFLKGAVLRLFFQMGNNSYVAHHSFLLNPHFNRNASFRIGSDSSIENDCHIDYSGGLMIGDDVWISENVFIATHAHAIDSSALKKSQPITFSSLEIGDDAWIGANSVILPQVSRIGKGAVIGAAAVVTKDVPDYAIVAGNPARILRYRN
ncbi:MAG: acyltransferase [Flavobacteriales bacterium]|nr:acyltransferase [Flavobacteriales bacterium]